MLEVWVIPVIWFLLVWARRVKRLAEAAQQKLKEAEEKEDREMRGEDEPEPEPEEPEEDIVDGPEVSPVDQVVLTHGHTQIQLLQGDEEVGRVFRVLPRFVPLVRQEKAQTVPGFP